MNEKQMVASWVVGMYLYGIFLGGASYYAFGWIGVFGTMIFMISLIIFLIIGEKPFKELKGDTIENGTRN